MCRNEHQEGVLYIQRLIPLYPSSQTACSMALRLCPVAHNHNSLYSRVAKTYISSPLRHTTHPHVHGDMAPVTPCRCFTYLPFHLTDSVQAPSQSSHITRSLHVPWDYALMMLPIIHQPQGPGIPCPSLRFPFDIPSPLVSRCLFTTQNVSTPLPSQFFPFLFLLFPHTAPTLGKSPHPHPSLPCIFHLHSIKHLHAAASCTAQKKKKVAVCCWSHACRLDASRSHHLFHLSLHTIRLSTASAMSCVLKRTWLACRNMLILTSQTCLATAATCCFGHNFH